MSATPKRTMALCLGLFSLLGSACDSAVEPVISVAELGKYTHIHDIAAAPTNTALVLLATHDGIASVSPDGLVRRISKDDFDFMSFSSHPATRTFCLRAVIPRTMATWVS